jgi:hypothetical protein
LSDNSLFFVVLLKKAKSLTTVCVYGEQRERNRKKNQFY